MNKRILSTVCVLCCIVILIPTASPVSAQVIEQTQKEVIVGGALFGIQIYTDGVLVVGIDKVTPADGGAAKAPAYEAGVRMNDIIVEINGKKVSDASTVTESIDNCNGNTISLKIRRGENEKELQITPIIDKNGKYRAGIWIRDAAAGIGTVTYIDPVTGEFGGLGHGICDGDTGAILPIKRGAVTDVVLSTIVRGQKGVPGELKGAFGGKKTGALLKNTECGVYGVITELPSMLGDKMQIAHCDEVVEGEAKVRSSVSGELKDYTVCISKLDRKSTSSKSFTIIVTDEELLSLTGGIVQGMSGSPIIQNGKLIGAVTHVFINDPSKGYGIFVENMLNAAQKSTEKAS